MVFAGIVLTLSIGSGRHSMAMFRDISREAAVAKSSAGLRTRSFIYAANNRLANFQAPDSSATDDRTQG